MKRIYENYTIYHQSEGAEQPVMTSQGAGLLSRSSLLLKRLQEAVELPSQGRLLDVGCGNGGFLKTCSEALGEWSLVGTEFDEKYKQQVENIPGVEGLHTGDVDHLSGQFDLISMLDVLEHIPNPKGLLKTLRSKLKPEGILLINLPDLRLNPFELTIADHCSHFQEKSVACLLESQGFRVELDTTSWVRKERVVVARLGPVRSARCEFDAELEVEKAQRSMDFLQSMVKAATTLRKRGPFGILGTSIAGTWLTASIGGDIDFFVDEDRARIGRQHMDKAILAPLDVPSGSRVLIALSDEISIPLKQRYSAKRPEVEWLVVGDVKD